MSGMVIVKNVNNQQAKDFTTQEYNKSSFPFWMNTNEIIKHNEMQSIWIMDLHEPGYKLSQLFPIRISIKFREICDSLIQNNLFRLY